MRAGGCTEVTSPRYSTAPSAKGPLHRGPHGRRGDADGKGGVPNITDGIYVLNFLFLGGPAAQAPGRTAAGRSLLARWTTWAARPIPAVNLSSYQGESHKSPQGRCLAKSRAAGRRRSFEHRETLLGGLVQVSELFAKLVLQAFWWNEGDRHAPRYCLETVTLHPLFLLTRGARRDETPY